jgi:hypothetical protein
MRSDYWISVQCAFIFIPFIEGLEEHRAPMLV